MQRARTAKIANEAPDHRAELKRAQVPVRTTPSAKDRLTAAAKANGRSLTQEIEQRLERSLETEERQGGPATAALIQAILLDISDIERRTGTSWAEDLATFGAVRHAIREAVEDRMPIPDTARPDVKILIGELAAANAIRRAQAAGLLPDTGAKDLEARDASIDDLRQRVIDPLEEVANRGRAIFDEICDEREQARALRRV